MSSTPKIGSRAAKALERRLRFLDDEVADLRVTLHRAHEHRERIEARRQDEINWLKKDLDRGRSEIMKVSRKGARVAESLRKQFDQRLAAAKRLVAAREGTIAWLRERNDRLRAAVVRATGLIASLREKNGRLRAEVRDLTAENAALASRVETLQAQLDRLRSTRSVLSKALYGSKSEQQKKPGTGRKRGQQRGAAGHGRTQRPGLRQKKETRDPPEDARVCPRCGKPYAANGERCTTLFEIEVEAYENTIVRPRYRRTCDCASSPREVTAPPVTRLFDNTPYGISVWVTLLPDPGPGGKLNTDLEGRDDKADEAAMGYPAAVDNNRMNDRIDEAVLALLCLGIVERHPTGGARAWKSFDWDAMGCLHGKGPEAQGQEAFKHGLGFEERPRGQDRQDEGRHDASGLQARARGGSGHRRGGGGRTAPGR